MKPVITERGAALSLTKLIRDMRREKKLSQGYLADEAGVHINTVSRMEAGKDVMLSVFERVADALGYEVELLPKETTNEQNRIIHNKEAVRRGTRDSRHGPRS